MTYHNTPMTTDSTTYQLNPHARFRILDDEGVFVLQEAGEVVVVNQVGAMIVKSLSDGQTLSHVVDQVVEQFEVDASTARADVDSLVADLNKAGALQPA